MPPCPGVLLVWSANRPREETFRIPPAGLVLGRGLFDGHDDRISREHLRLAIEDKQRVVATDLGSRNGSYVNGHAIVERKVASRFPAIVRTGRTVWVAVDDVRPYEGVAIERRGRLVVRGTLAPTLRDVHAAGRDERSIALVGSLTVGRELARCYHERCLGDFVRLASPPGGLANALAGRGARTIAIELARLLGAADVETLRGWLADERRIIALTSDPRWITGLPADVAERLPAISIPQPRLDELPATLAEIVDDLAPGAVVHASAIAETLMQACNVDEDRLIRQLKSSISVWRLKELANLRDDDLDFADDDDPMARCIVIERPRRVRRPRVRDQAPRASRVDSAIWAARRLCPDGGCIGLIGADNACKVCGKTVPLEDPYR